MTLSNPCRRGSMAIGRIALSLVLCATVTNATPKQKSEIDQLVRTYHGYRLFNGTVFVARYGLRLFSGGIGHANMEWEVPNTSNTRMRIGPVTELLTATLVLQLVDAGELELHRPIRAYLPDYAGPGADTITIHHLLTHTSGVADTEGDPPLNTDDRRSLTRQRLTSIASRDLAFAPGSGWSRSRAGYLLLGAIVETVTGTFYEDALSERVLDPIKMKNSGIDDGRKVVDRRAMGYVLTVLGHEVAPPVDMPALQAAAGGYATAEDLYKWDVTMGKHEILSDSLVTLMREPHVTIEPGADRHQAYGWTLREQSIGDEDRTVTVLESTGEIHGFQALMLRVPADDHMVILLSNTGRAPLEEMAENILNIMYELPRTAPREPIANVIGERLEKKGLEKAIDRYRKLREDDSDRYDFSEGELRRLGRELVARGDLEKAVAIFELNVEAYPSSASSHDDLAATYADLGDRDRAIETYRRSLDLDPGNESARRALREIESTVEG